MAVELRSLLQELEVLLSPDDFRDYCPNGLQVEGKSEPNKIVSGLTTSHFLVQDIMQPNVMAYRPWAPGWRKIRHST